MYAVSYGGHACLPSNSILQVTKFRVYNARTYQEGGDRWPSPMCMPAPCVCLLRLSTSLLPYMEGTCCPAWRGPKMLKILLMSL